MNELKCSECGENFPFESHEHICKTPIIKEEKLYFGDMSNAGKWHIFREARSLCRKWMLLRKFDDEDLVKDTSTCGRDDCKMCFKELDRIRKTKQESKK